MTRIDCYNKLYRAQVSELKGNSSLTEDKISRMANKYAVQNTDDLFRKATFIKRITKELFNSPASENTLHLNRFGMPDYSVTAKENNNIRIVKLKSNEVYFISIEDLSVAFDDKDIQGDIDNIFNKLSLQNG